MPTVSKAFSIACTQCKKRLWIAQGWPHPMEPSPFESCVLYYGEKHTMEALRVFLFTHMDHPLAFKENDTFFENDDNEYEEIETERYRD